MARQMSETTLAILSWFKEHKASYHHESEVREAFPGYDPKLVNNCMRTLLRNGSISTVTGQRGTYAYSVPPETVQAEPEPTWVTEGRRRSEERARIRIHQLMRAYM